MRIDLGGLALDPGIPDSVGAIWIPTDLQGWEGAEHRSSSLEPTGRHGSIPTEDLLGPRIVVIEGTCKAPSSSAFWNAWNRCSNFDTLLQPAVIDIVVYETQPKFVWGSTHRAPRMKFLNGGAFDFQLTFICHNPFKQNV